jgi:muramoyltetrapeptide carboxypeptidase LdcA involved in peptidoglycan recycling
VLQKPKALQKGDTIASVSLSWGGAGDADLLWRYQVGKERLETLFGLTVVEMPNTLKGSTFLADHPQSRAQDLMDALCNPSIKAVFSCIGGNDSIRLLPFIDFSLLAEHPKIFLGYSDSTVTHLMFYKAGVGSFYGPSILAEFAENLALYPYTEQWVRKTLFSNDKIGTIEAPLQWTGERLPWTEDNRSKSKQMFSHEGYQVLQGDGVMEGPLLGGCLEVLDMCIGTSIWPDFSGSLLFLETSEETPSPRRFSLILDRLVAAGMMDGIKGILLAKPYQEVHVHAYLQVLRLTLSRLGLGDMPVAYNLAFGHNEPMCILPYGTLTRFDCRTKTLSILESAVAFP